MNSYAKRLKGASFFSFAACCLTLLVSKARGREALFGFALAAPSLLVVVSPPSWIRLERGLVLGHSFALACICSLFVLAGLASIRTESLLFVPFLILCCEVILLSIAARGERLPNGTYKSDPNEPKVLLIAGATVAYVWFVIKLFS